jgi:hypothetical protein
MIERKTPIEGLFMVDGVNQYVGAAIGADRRLIEGSYIRDRPRNPAPFVAA